MQPSLFDFQSEATPCKINTKSMDDLLERMKHYIDTKVLFKTETHYKMFMKREPRIVPSWDKKQFDLIFTPWSSSSCFLHVFEEYGDEISSKTFLNEIEKLGGYTASVWPVIQDKNIKPSNLIEMFRIHEGIRSLIYATGSKEVCEEVAKLIIDWNLNYLHTFEMPELEDKLSFMRKSKPKKGEIERTRCMDGECIGTYLLGTRETSF